MQREVEHLEVQAESPWVDSLYHMHFLGAEELEIAILAELEKVPNATDKAVREDALVGRLVVFWEEEHLIVLVLDWLVLFASCLART